MRGGRWRVLVLAGAGGAALIASGGFGTPALLPLGVGLLVLPVLSIALVTLASSGTLVERSLDRDRVPADGVLGVGLYLRGWPVRTGLLGLLDWSVDPGLPAEPRTKWGPARRDREGLGLTVRVSGLPRGEHRLADPRLRVADPFGLYGRERSFPSSQAVLALAPVLSLGGVRRWTAAGVAHGDGAAGSLAGTAALDGVREYLPGDPLSMVHWRQTAKRGRLQTKELVGAGPRASALTVLLDGRAGTPSDPFEVAVVAAASLLRRAWDEGRPIRLLHSAARTELGRGLSDWPAAERALATVACDGTLPVSLAAARVVGGSAAEAGGLVVVTTHADTGLVASAAGARDRGALVHVLLVGPACIQARQLAAAGLPVVACRDLDDLGRALGEHDRAAA